MSKPKLTYFNVTGLAEPARFLFAYGDIEYEDNRIEKADWPAVKSNYAFGQLPVLEVDGHVINQHKAIARYAAKQAKLCGNNDVEDALIDAAVDSINDLRIKISEPFYETDEAIIAAKKEKIANEIVPSFIEKFEALLDKNNGYFALGRLTWADVYFAAYKDFLRFVLKDGLEKSAKLTALTDKVRDLPKIKNWIATRPVTEM